MAICKYCGKNYSNYDNDAGTYKEWYCSITCEQKVDEEIDKAVSNKAFKQVSPTVVRKQ